MRREILNKEAPIPEGVTVKYDTKVFVATGPKGEVSRAIYYPAISIKVEGDNVVVESKNVGKKEKMMFGTIFSHITNILEGAANGYTYKLKICSGHFPMNVKLNGNKFSVVNLFGEKVPRLLTIKEGAKVTIDGDFITVDANDKELAGQVAADIEQLTRISNKDRRIFQDGIYITEKNGKQV